MNFAHRLALVLLTVWLVVGTSAVRAQVPAANFVNFEARQTTPLRLSPDGNFLFAVNTADARLSVFNITQTPPVLMSEIPVGVEPVSVNARTNNEAWVVNELSDSVSIVSVSQGIVADTINVKDEPADVVLRRRVRLRQRLGQQRNPGLRRYESRVEKNDPTARPTSARTGGERRRQQGLRRLR